ncbi:MAG: hypothetical protein U5L09_08965 [Bacteroidales bacterium]|nr:hypothetical protein [Bacteroidales bacterium]
MFLVQVIPFVIKKSQGNYVNFHIFFFFSFFFTNFFYPTILYPIDPDFFFVFTLPFDFDYINKGTALAQLAASSFILGASHIKINQKQAYNKRQKLTFLGHKPATYTTIFLFVLFILIVGPQFLQGKLRGELGRS